YDRPIVSRDLPQPEPTHLPFTTLFRSLAMMGHLAVAGNAQAYQLPDFTQLAEKQGPAVVNISITQVVQDNGSPFAAMPQDEALRSEEHTSELQSREKIVCRLLLEKKKK